MSNVIPLNKDKNAGQTARISLAFLKQQLESDNSLHDIEDIGKMFFHSCELTETHLEFNYTYNEEANK